MRPIRTLLVANRGEIAVRVLEAAHQLGLATVAVYAEPDRTAPHVGLADVAVPLDGVGPTETYLDQAKLLDAALAQGADAVHPGYGFLSENATFAQAVVDAGLTWVGPRPEAIAVMGDKLAAKRLAVEVGVPTLPSAGLDGDDERHWQTQAASVGYPLLVKAAAGGGGRGMRLVSGQDELADAVRSARREAASSFGDPTVFAERWLAAPHHIEVQLVADQHGNALHLGERECSIQRRHQKLIEECPSPAVDDLLRDRLGAAALTLARAIAYDNVGTVEFLLDADHQQFYFLEMNTRIQVEHRVTEDVVGCDLVWWQIQCARGEPLQWLQEDVDLTETHAVEVRLYAEDPARDWMPATGTIHRFHSDEFHDDYVTVDTGVTTTLDGPVDHEVTPHFDPLLAKFTARGYTRDTAIGRLVRFLTQLELHGLATNRDYLLAVLQHPDFLDGNTTTLFVADHPALLEAGLGAEAVAAHVAVAALAAARRRHHDQPWSFAPQGWRNLGVATQSVRFEHRGTALDATYRVDGDRFEVQVEGIGLAGRILHHELAPTHQELLVEIDGSTRRYSVRTRGSAVYVNSTLGQTDLVARERFAEPSALALAGGPTAPVPGRVVAVEVTAGDRVESGQTLVVLEAMKVEHHVRAPGAGTVLEVLVAVDDTVDAQQLLIRLEDPR